MDLVGLLSEPARRASLEVQSLIALARAGEVVFLDELRRNPTGKILKRELATLGD
jgi:acyl-coenzyme A synthetase/AMP-(fatty) acid ligase